MKRQTEYLHVRIAPATKAKLTRLAKKRNLTMSEMVRELVEKAA